MIGGCNPQSAEPVKTACARVVEQVLVPAGTYQVGDERFYRDEGPVHRIEVDAFEIDATEVTNRQFREFITATGYKTRAERGLPEAEFEVWPAELRTPGSAVFLKPASEANMNPANWWKFVEGASWRAPFGPGSDIEGLDEFPVVHIAYEDAQEYAEWAGRRLPTEDEWEIAARGGSAGKPYAWGDTPPDELVAPAANTWQGIFPFINSERDGYEGVSPVGCFAPNAYGAYDMIGNVWEWTSDPYYPDRTPESRDQDALGGFDPAQPGVSVGVIKGGSFLCAENYCARFRPAARHAQDLMLGASHIGFRTARTIQQ